MDNIYSIELTDDDPKAPDPERIIPSLKPHQKAALYKALQLETTGIANYNIENPQEHIRRYRAYQNYNVLRGRVSIKTNVGIIGDIVGYGKTLAALSVIAQNPVSAISHETHIVKSVSTPNMASFTASMVRPTNNDNFIHTTLVVVPRGPVYVQWETAIRTQTRMKVLALESLHGIRKLMPPVTSTREDIKNFMETFDIVLVKNTSFATLCDYYPNLPDVFSAWDRVMIDEAHDIISKTPLVRFHFLWLISATYKMLAHTGHGSRSNMLYGVQELFVEEYMNLILIKSTREFVEQSFAVPQPIEHVYMCKFDRRFAVVRPFLSSSVQERLNANDIRGAISELGGSSHTEDDIVELVTRELKKNIHNKEIEINMSENMMMTDEQREIRLGSLKADLARLQEKLTHLVERLTMLDTKTCPICYDNYTNPIMLDCTHVFCGGCLMTWMRTGEGCPTCRAPIKTNGCLHAIVANTDVAAASSSQPRVQEQKGKEDTTIEIIRKNPNGKYLIFSRHEPAFFNIIAKLTYEQIPYVEMKGSTSHMMKCLESFKNGNVNVCLLSTVHAGSGIDLSCATDVILLHSLGVDRDQAVGRAQRQGRTSQLHIHSLLYPHETI
jgi:SNF2 family DNA or RNA helicase